MVTNQPQKKFGLNPEFRITDVLQLLMLLVAFTVWQIRTEGRIGEVAAANKANATHIEAVSASLSKTAALLDQIAERQVSVRLWIAGHEGAEGAAGPAGPRGETGATGARGATGKQGEKGEW